MLDLVVFPLPETAFLFLFFLQILTGLQCGHIFCQYCWNEYLITKILNENTGENIFCPASNCDILVDENFVM